MSNRELPMMPWYPDQFAASTSTWTFTERAVYRALLDVQWAQDVLPDSEVRLAKACGLTLNHFRQAWKTVKSKFPRTTDHSGLRNLRLEEHRLAAFARKEAIARAGRAGGLAKAQRRSSDATSDATATPLAPLYPPSPSPSPSEESEHPQPPQGGRNGLSATGGRKPREVRDRSLNAWREIVGPVDQVAATGSLPSGQRLTWAYVQEHVQDRAAVRAAETVGFRAIADRDKFTTSDLQARFREAYEQQLERSPDRAPPELHA